ncbi:hypothetical protein SFRURICE_003115 [Spodoptera frugiperda]|nr:hypothetical protein SFRURICE_003115 [Spodoptera frugiperda]
MDTIGASTTSRTKWRLNTLVTLYILLFTQCKGDNSQDITKTDVKLDNNLDSISCHSCYSNSPTESHVEKYVDVVDDIVGQLNTFTDKHLNLNKTVVYLENAVEEMLDKALSNDRFKILDGVEVKPVSENGTTIEKKSDEARALFSKYTYEYRIYQKIKDFVNTHILSINLPMAAKSFGLNKFFIPILIGGQVLIKTILFAMFLPSILGSFGKMLSKGLEWTDKKQDSYLQRTVFQKIPASSMILSNYDPFYSPLLSRLDGIFARLGLAPAENSVDENIEACREQLICLMYASPAKFAPYSNLVSAQLSRELNELRRPVSDNPEILRFFKYMKAARRGQETSDCMYAYPTCTANAPKTHTMIAAYHDINKLVTARKLQK